MHTSGSVGYIEYIEYTICWIYNIFNIQYIEVTSIIQVEMTESGNCAAQGLNESGLVSKKLGKMFSRSY